MSVSPAESDFDSYVRASGPRLKRLSFLLTGDLDTAEDLLQSAYAKVLPRWAKVGDYDNPDAYMRRVMVSIRTSWWRRLRGREVLTADFPRGGVAGRDLAVDVGELDYLLTGLRALPRRQQVAVVLRHYCDLSEAETATVMGISVGGVKSQTSKGLAALRVGHAPSPTIEEPSR
ncbi:MAG: SigE family RNA polymerase sigma factor [Sporichthyaceae bacterium]